jgi:malate synthase
MSYQKPWFIDLLNLNLNNDDLEIAQNRISRYYEKLITTGQRITENLEFELNTPINI